MPDRFRPDIEGLRALAVLPILLFHLDSALCPGGYIGVDIFFVISGYLITRMIVAQGDAFTFKAFYVRRFFRLFPALLVTLVATLVAGWWLLSPDDYAALGQSMVAAGVGFSNVFFWLTVDYFNADGFAHPLLHTWSLGAEEQFYLVWPALIVLARRCGLPWNALLLGAAAVSLGAVAATQPVSPQFAFYMMPCRVFEFAVGAGVLGLERSWSKLPAVAATIAGAAACVLLLVSFGLFDGLTPWPGARTLVPAVAVALMLLAGREGLWSAVLGCWPLRFIGRTSYSIYLVHWPLIVFYRAWHITPPDRFDIVLLGLGSIAGGALLYALVEQPFRLKGVRADSEVASATLPPTGRGRLALAILAIAGVAGVSGAAAAIATHGFPSRIERATVQAYDKGLTFAGDLCSRRTDRCQFGARESHTVVYLIGDSHALNLLHGLDKLFRETGIKGIAFYKHGCLFAVGTTRFLKGVVDPRCRDAIKAAFAHLAGTRDPVIIAGDYAGYRNEIGPVDATAALRQSEAEYYAFVRDHLRQSLETLHAGERRIVLVKQAYSTGVDLAKCLLRPTVAGGTDRTACTPALLAQARARSATPDAMIEALAALQLGVQTIDPKPLFCTQTPCTTGDADNGLYFRDAIHLTNAGSDFLVEKMRPALLPVLTGRP